MKRPQVPRSELSLCKVLYALLICAFSLVSRAYADAQATRIEPESPSIQKLQSGSANIETQGDSRWSGGQQLWWRNAKVGDTLELSVQVPSAGFYTVVTGLTKAVDYGIFDFSIGGKVARKNVDCYSPNVQHNSVITLSDSVFLDAGTVKLSALVRGANPLAIKSYMLGWDYIDLVPSQEPSARSFSVRSGASPVEIQLAQKFSAPADWLPPISWQISDVRPTWVTLSSDGFLSLTPPPTESPNSEPILVHAVARDSSTPQKSQPFSLRLFVKEPALPPENELLFTQSIVVAPGGTSLPTQVSTLIPENSGFTGSTSASLLSVVSEGQFEVSLADGGLSITAQPNAVPGTYAVFIAVSDQQNPSQRKIGRIAVLVRPTELSQPDVRISKSVQRGDFGSPNNSIDLALSLGAQGESLIPPLSFAKLPDAIGYAEGVSVMLNGSSVSLSATENQAAPDSTTLPVFFSVTDSSPTSKKLSVLLDLTIKQPSVPEGVPSTDRFALNVPVTLGSQPIPYSVSENLPQTVTLSGNRTFTLLRNPHIAKLSVFVSPSGELSITPMPSAGAGNYPVQVKISDGTRTVYGDISIQLTAPQVPPVDFEISVQSVVGQPTPTNIDLASKLPQGLSNQSQWSVLSNPSASSLELFAYQSNLTLIPKQTAAPGEYIAFLKVSDTTQAQPIEKVVRLRVLVAPSAPQKVDFVVDRELLIGSPNSMLSLQQFLPQSLGLQGQINFSLYSSTAPLGTLSANVSMDGQLSLNSYQSQTSQVTTGVYPLYVAAVDSASKTVYGQVNVRLVWPTPNWIDAEISVYHGLTTPPSPVDLAAKLQSLPESLPSSGASFELFADNAPAYLKKVDYTGTLATAPVSTLQPGSQSLIIKASSPVGVRFVKVWLHAVGTASAQQPGFEVPILASRGGSSQTISLLNALQGAQSTSAWSVEILDNPLANSCQFVSNPDGSLSVTMARFSAPITSDATVRLKSLDPANPIQAVGKVRITPKDFSTSGLLTHYDATRTDSVITEGGSVSQWKDLSGNNHHLTAFPGSGPSYLNSSDLRVLDFNPSKGLTVQNVPLSENLTVFVVLQPSELIQTWGSYIHHGNHDSDWAIRMNGAPGSKTGFHSSNDNTVVQEQLAADSPYVLVGRLQSTENSSSDQRLFKVFRSDGSEAIIQSSNLQKTITSGLKPLYVGNSDSNEPSNAKIGEIIYFSKGLSDSDIAFNASYLINKWLDQTANSGTSGGGAIVPPVNVQVPIQTLFRSFATTVDLNQHISATLGMTPPYSWSVSATQMPQWLTISQNGQLTIFPEAAEAQTNLAATLTLTVTDASSPQKTANLSIPIELADLTPSLVASAIQTDSVQVTVGTTQSPIDLRTIIQSASTKNNLSGFSASDAKLSIAAVRSYGAFSAHLLEGDQLALELSPNAPTGAFDLLVNAVSSTPVAAPFRFRVPVLINGPANSGADLIIPQTIVRGLISSVDVPSKVLSPLGIVSPAEVQLINASGLSAGLSVSLSTDGNTLVISANPSTDGLTKDSIFLKIIGETQNGVLQKIVRLDCTVSTFAIPAGTESFTAELNVLGNPSQETSYSVPQLLPWNISWDSTFQCRIIDASQLLNKGIDASLSSEGLLKVKPLVDFVPGRYQATIELKNATRVVYGFIWINQSSFTPPETTFELSVELPVGGQLKSPVNLTSQLALSGLGNTSDPTSVSGSTTTSGTTVPQELIFEQIYNASKRGISAYISGSSLVQVTTAPTAYLGKNVIYVKAVDSLLNITRYGKLNVLVLPAQPNHVDQELNQSVSFNGSSATLDLQTALAAPLANRQDLDFSIYSSELPAGMVASVSPNGALTIYATPGSSPDISKGASLHFAVREMSTGATSLVTANISFQSGVLVPGVSQSFTYLNINSPAMAIDLSESLFGRKGSTDFLPELVANDSPSDISAQIHGRYVVIRPLPTAQPGSYTLQFRLPDSNPSEVQNLTVHLHGDSFSSTATASPYSATAEWDSPNSLQLVSSVGTVSLKISANQAQNFIRGELTGGAVKFFVNRYQAIPGVYKVRVTDPRSPQVQLNIDVNVPQSLFAEPQQPAYVARQEVLEGVSNSTFDIRALFPQLSASSNYTFSILSSAAGNPLRATVSSTGTVSIPDAADSRSSSSPVYPVESEYFAIRGGISWTQAKDDAIKRGGHLATITSASELNKMMQQIGSADSLWLGATDDGSEGKWRWVTGEPWSFQNWAGGEPNNCCGGENYLVVGGGNLWNDAGGWSSGYVLEVPLKSVYILATSSNAAPELLRLDVTSRAPQFSGNIETPFVNGPTQLDLNFRLTQNPELGSNRTWELVKVTNAANPSSVSLSPSGVLQIAQPQHEDSLSITARVKDVTSGISTFVTFNINTAPPSGLEILAHPRAQFANSGSRVLLSVDAVSPLRDTSRLSYQWRLNGEPVPGAVFSAHTFILNDRTKGVYSVTVSDGQSQKSSNPALIDTNNSTPVGHLASTVQTVVLSGSSTTLQLPSSGFKIRQVVLNPTAALSSVNSLASADLLLSLPSNDSRVSITYILYSQTLNHYGDGEAGHYSGKAKLPKSEPSYVLKAEGTLFIPESGVYTFGINSDDGSRIMIDGIPVLTDDSNHGAQDFLSQPVNLSSGLHSVEVVMFEGGGGDHVEFFAAPGAHSAWNEQFSLVGSPQGLKVFMPAGTVTTASGATQTGTTGSTSTTATDSIFFDDSWMAGMQGTAGEVVSTGTGFMPSSGDKMMKLQGDHNDVVGFPTPWKPSSSNGTLFFDVYIPSDSNSTSFMLQVNSRNGWEHRAVWGDMSTTFAWGTAGTESRKKVGELPPKGQWSRLVLPLSAIGITSSDYINQLAFSQPNGLLFIDRIGYRDTPPFQWFKDGQPIQGANSAALKFAAVSEINEGIYTLEVSSGGIPVSSSSVFLLVRDANWDPSDAMHPLLQPVATQFRIGAPLSLSALVSGPLDVRYEWKKNGQILPTTSSDLTVVSARELDAGVYSVSAVSDTTLRRFDFAPVNVSVFQDIVKPSFPITSIPRNIQLISGSALNIMDSASGSEITYSWLKNGQPLPNFKTNQLFIPSVSSIDAGQYVLVATNSAGSAMSEPFTVSIETPPVFSESGQPRSTTVLEGQLLELFGFASGASAYQWYLNGIALPEATSNSYRVLKAASINSGVYNLIATSAFGLSAESKSVQVEVLSKPMIQIQPMPRFVQMGASVVFSVEATGTGPLAYRWLKNNQPVPNATSKTLALASASDTDVAVYSVEVSNQYGSASSTGAQLAIIPSILPDGQPKTPSVRLGDSFALSVEAVGTGALSYQWMKNGEPIAGATARTFSVVTSSNNDEGVYRVDIKNGYGSASSNSVLIGYTPALLADLPDQILSPRGSDIILSANFSGTAPIKYTWSKDGVQLSNETPVFFETFNSYQGNQNAKQIGTELRVAHSGAVRGWNQSGTNAIHAVERSSTTTQPDWAVMIFKDNVLTSPQIDANALGRAYRISFEISPAVYAFQEQGTMIGDGLAIDLLRADGSVVTSTEQLTGSWSAGAMFASKQFDYQGDGSGPVRIRIGSSRNITDDRFMGTIDNISVFETTFSGPSLTIRNLQSQNAGTYQVVASNAFGATTSRTSQVSIREYPPVIKTQVQSVVATIGGSASLSVAVQSDLPVSYQWFRNGSATPYQSAEINLTSVSPLDLGEYFVIARNSAGEVSSQKARIDAPPSFGTSQEPQFLSQQEGDRVIIAPNVAGSLPMSFQWLKNGQPIVGATSPSLVFQSVNPNDDGEYVLEIKNAYGTQRSSTSKLSVSYRLKIVSSPVSVTSNTGTPVLFSVTAASSFGPIRYQWRRNARPIPGAVFPVFGIESVSSGNQGLYDVIVSDSQDSLTAAAANLAVSDLFSVKLVAQTPHAVLNQGDVVNVSVDAPANSSLQWRRNGLAMPQTAKAIAITEPGLYDVVATNSMGRIGSRQMLIVSSIDGSRDFTRFLRIPVSINAFVGQLTSVSGYAISSSASPITYSWSKNGTPIQNNGTSVLLSDKLAQVEDSGTFSVGGSAGSLVVAPVDFSITVSDIPTPPQLVESVPSTINLIEGAQLMLNPRVIGSSPITFEWSKDGKVLSSKTQEFARSSAVQTDAGVYTLKAVNPYGELSVGPIVVSIASGPIRLVSAPKSLRIGTGSPASFSVDAIGSEPLEYQWFKNGSILNGQKSSTLQIPQSDGNSAGIYEVRVAYVSNPASAITATATLTVEQPPQITGIRIQPTPHYLNGIARVKEGSVISLNLSANGVAPLKYRWLRSGIPFGTDSAEIVTPPLSTADSGLYSVIVESQFGSAVADPIQLRVVPPPKITKQPRVVTVREGSPLTLAIETQSSEPLTFKWSKDSVTIESETQSAIRKAQATPSDSGLYSMSVMDGVSEIQSEPIQVIVSPEFEIKTNPSSISAVSNQDVELFVLTDSVNSLRYQWFKDNTEIPGAVGVSLRLRSVSASDTADYFVRVTSTVTSKSIDSKSARLVVDAQLAFVKNLDPQPRNFGLNEPVSLDVQVSGSGTLRYQWEVRDDNGPWIVQTATGSRLNLSGSPKETSRSIRVSVSNGGPNSIVSQVAVLNVLDIPAIINWSNPQITRVGARAEMSISVTGAGAQVVWTRANTPQTATRVETFQGITKSTLSIAQVSASDAGTYTASVTSPRSLIPLVRTFELVVNESPFQITKQPTSIVVREGQSGRLSLGFESGSSDLSFQWKKNGVPIVGQTSPVFNLFKAKLSDEGVYTLEVSTKLLPSPVESEAATVTVETSPVILSQPEPVSVRETTATALEVVARGSASMSYQWYFSKESAGATRQLLSNALASRLEFSAVSPDQAGFYWVEVTNAIGVISSNRVKLDVVPALNITSLPKSTDTALGGSASLAVGVDSLYPDSLRFQWYRLPLSQSPTLPPISTVLPAGARPIPGADKASLLIESISEDDSAEYIVDIVDTTSRKVVRGASVRAVTPPKVERLELSVRVDATAIPTVFTSPLEELTVCSGNLVEVRIVSSGTLPATASISSNGHILASSELNSGSSSVSFKALKQHAGVLIVKVANLAGTSESAPINIKVSDGLKIVTQPQSVTVDAQARAELTVKAVGLGKLTYRWSRNGAFLYESNIPSLVLSRVAVSDAGIYQVRVSDGVSNEISAGAILELRNIILLQPQSVTARVGQSARLRVELSSDDYDVQWTKAGVAIPGATSTALQFASVRSDDFSSYQAIITHRVSRDEILTSTAALMEAPDLTNLSVNGTNQVKSGSATILSVPTEYLNALQGARFQWFKNFQPISGATGSNLSVSQVSSVDAGSYSVQIVSAQGTFMSKPFALSVNEPDLLFNVDDVQLTQGGQQSIDLLSFDRASVGFFNFEIIPNSNRLGASMIGRNFIRLTAPAGAVGLKEIFEVKVFAAGGLQLGKGRLTVSVPAGSPPVISSHPVSTGVPQGATASLTVQATGGTLRYQWRVGGTNIIGANSPILSANAATDQYDCVVSNEAGSVTSAPASVFAVEPPRFTIQPASVKGITVGSSASLWVSVDSSYPVVYQWYKDGEAIPGETSRVFNLQGFTPSDEGAYHVTATNKFGVFAQSEPASLSLSDTSIRIIAQPYSQSVLENSPVTLQVVAKGPQLSYRWFKQNDSAFIPVGDSRILTQPVAQAGTFICEVSSPVAGTVRSVPATVKVLKSEFGLNDSKLSSKQVSLMDSLALGVSVIGEGSFNFQWMKDGVALETPAARRDTLIIQQVGESDAGSYSVKVSRGEETRESKVVQVTIATPLSFVTQPVSPSSPLYAGQASIDLFAEASAANSIYQWRKNGVAIPKATAKRFTLTPQGASDSGTYDVIASTLEGSRVTGRIASQPAFIRVVAPLKITNHPKSVVANPGDGIVLESSTEGGSPSFQWFFKRLGSNTPAPLDGQTLSRLEIPSASLDSEGTYFVTVTSPNQPTLTSSQAFVKINKPVTITRNISSTPTVLAQGKSMTLQIAATGTAPIRYQWRKDGNPIKNATNQRLIVTNSASAASATYDCLVSNIVGPVTSNASPIVMAGRLDIADQPTPATVLNPGERFTVAVSLSNPTGTEKIQWYRSIGKTTRAVSGATSPTLAIQSVKDEDEGVYFAVITGQVKLTSKLASLKVNKPIKFVSQPPDSIAAMEGRDLSLSVEVTGTSTKEVPISFQWLYNGSVLPGARSSTLSIKNASVNSSGIYSVIAENVAGKVSSREFNVKVSPSVTFSKIYAMVNGSRRAPQPVITENPSSMLNPVKFKLATDVTSSDFALEYRWRVNGRRILSPSAETSVLDFDSLGQAEAGEYDLTITIKNRQTGAIVDETTLDAVTVIVNEPVTVTTVPMSQGTNTGAQIELRTGARGTGLAYQWMKFNPLSMVYEPLLGANSPTLPITVNADTQGKYKVAFSGAVNQVELSEINVWNLDSVRIEKQPENLIVIAGDTATFTVDARQMEGSSGSLSYRWRKNRATTGMVAGTITSIDVVQTGSGYLQRPTVEIVPTGQGSGATAEAQMELDPSGETLRVARIVVTNGGSGYDSAPEVRILGEIKPNLEGTIGRRATAGIFAAPSQQSAPELVLSNVSEADQGDYYVEVFDGAVDDNAPRLTSSIVNLTVQGRAKIEMQPTKLTAVEGLPFRLDVVASGNNAVYQWTKSLTAGANVITEFSTDVPSIHFPALRESDSGVYRLNVFTENPQGTATSQEIQLNVIALPKELSQPEPLIERNPLESFYIEPQISSAPQGQTFFYQWFKNDREIMGAVGRTLFINQAAESDEGRYRLEVYSEAGVLRASPVDLSINDIPRIIASPESITVDPESPFSLTVSALGRDLTYQWFLNGVAIPDALSSTYACERAVNGETEGVYSVVVSSSTRYGGVGEPLKTSAKATVAVKDPTLIVKNPSSDDVSGINLNASRTWAVEAQGTNLRYQWQKNGTDIPGAVQKTYRLGNAQLSDEGVYRVVVTGDLGVSASNDFVLEINKAPMFISQPRSISAVAGGTLDVPAEVSGSSPIRFQWRKDGRPLASQTSSVLRLSGVSNNDSGSYDVIVTNPVGTIRSAPFSVTVMTPPIIVTEPTSVVVIPGESPSLLVAASSVGPLSYQWFKDGELIEGATESELRLQNVSLQSDGRYSVSVSNEAGSVFSQTAKLTVLSPVIITAQPYNTRVLLRGKASFSVEVSEGSLPVSYQWRRNGSPLPNGTNKTLSLASVQTSDAGDYDVVITNDAGSVTSTSASLTIDSAMVAPTLPAKLSVDQGSGASISVTPTGEGPFTYQWRKNGQNILGATEDVLVFEFASVTDSGVYDVVISNPSSSVTSSKTELQVAARINIIKQPASVLAANNDSVSLSVQASASGPLSYQWRKNGVNLSGATLPSLPLVVSADTLGVYDVIISETSEQSTYSIISGAAAVEVSIPVNIVSKPKSLDVFQGDGAAFDVIATGTGPLTYSWSLAGKAIPNETTHRLVISQVNAKPPATLSYTVTVSDGKTSVTATASLTVRARPSAQSLAVAQASDQDTNVNLVQSAPVRSYLVEAKPIAGAAPYEGRIYLDAETESAVISDLTGALSSSFRAPETGVTLAPALGSGEIEVLKLEFRSDSGVESWSLQGPANLVATQGNGAWMANTLVGLRKVYDTTGKLLGTWMVSVQFEESVLTLPPAISGSSVAQ